MFEEFEAKIKKSVDHQGIGGKTIRIEREIDKTTLFLQDRIATVNFVNRRPDIKYDSPQKIYYGHVEEFGYVVAEDELGG